MKSIGLDSLQKGLAMKPEIQLFMTCFLMFMLCSCASWRGLPEGYVQGDVASYSYVPNKSWTFEEGIGKLPYLCEYGLMVLNDKGRLEDVHAENLRRIDLASQWSTVIMLYARKPHYHDEIINLMLRCFKNRQLILIRDYASPDDAEPYANTIAILETLWANRDRKLISPEGDTATGRQLINNILAVKLGDEGLHVHKTAGLEKIHEAFKTRVKNRVMDGQTPFKHIKSWYNMIHYGLRIYAASQKDMDEHGCLKIPANCEFIGVDTYHYWWIPGASFDPMDPSIPAGKIRDESEKWQDIVTRYYPAGLKTEPTDQWLPESRNDTHALMSAIEFAGAKDGMMIFIANSSGIPGKYTTPTETMDAFYDSLREGPWVGLVWWVWDAGDAGVGTMDYVDKSLMHYTPENPKGTPYGAEDMERIRKKFIASRMRMFEDVVYNQFGDLNNRPKE